MSEEQEPAESAPTRPDWRLVGVFYGVCLGWVSLLGLGLWLAGAQMSTTGTKLVFQLTVAFLYMPAPLVAALIAERVGGRRPLIRSTFDGFGRKLPRLLLTFVVLVAGVYVAGMALTFVLGNLAHVPGIGVLATSQPQLTANLRDLLGPLAQSNGTTANLSKVPPLPLLYLLGIVSGLSAGLTINGLFAFGEEYGWRGFLMDELRPLGAVRANLLTGVLWGLFHAPLILLGFNFAPYNLAGIVMMCVLCTPFSFLLWFARERTGSLLAPAVLHGAFNGFSGFFLMLIIGRNPLVAAPVGLAGAAGIAIVAALYASASSSQLSSARTSPQ
jgi:uncharacterized protein